MCLADLFPVSGVHPEPVAAGSVDRKFAELVVARTGPVAHRDGALGALKVSLGHHIPAGIDFGWSSGCGAGGNSDTTRLQAGDYSYRLWSEAEQQSRNGFLARFDVGTCGYPVLRVVHRNFRHLSPHGYHDGLSSLRKHLAPDPHEEGIAVDDSILEKEAAEKAADLRVLAGIDGPGLVVGTRNEELLPGWLTRTDIHRSSAHSRCARLCMRLVDCA